MRGWANTGTWEGEQLRREVFFFAGAGTELYGSIYAPPSAAAPRCGLLICNSWGYEANLAAGFVHPFSLEAARAGAVAASFHYPGFGDSGGAAEELTIDAMAEASQAALREVSDRAPGLRWALAGVALGASVAALAVARGAAVAELLLVQPALQPARYFARLERASKRSLGAPAPTPEPGFAYGYRLAAPLLDSVHPADGEVGEALAAFAGKGAVARCERPDLDGVPVHFDLFEAPGVWRFGARNYSPLVGASQDWLRERLRATV